MKKILALDVSTSCIGVAVIEETESGTPKIIDLKHHTPQKIKDITPIEALFIKSDIFENEFLVNYKDFGIDEVVIEEPLLSSNNVNTVATLLRFNGMISKAIYHTFNIVPTFLSSYDSRKYSFPDLLAIRSSNKKGVKYKKNDIIKTINNNCLTLFGDYQWDIDKKQVMMNKINDNYDGIKWFLNKKGNIAKENYDACDALICALAKANINKYGYGIEPTIRAVEVKTNKINYEVDIWGKIYKKEIIL